MGTQRCCSTITSSLSLVLVSSKVTAGSTVLLLLVNEIANPVYNKWYMDDGGIIGDVELLKKVWEILKARGPALGLHLNPSKCEWSWLDPNCVLPCPIRLDGMSE